jgi:hypothetical protein
MSDINTNISKGGQFLAVLALKAQIEAKQQLKGSKNPQQQKDWKLTPPK